MKTKIGTALDHELIRRARSVAAREGKRFNEILEEALSDHLRRKSTSGAGGVAKGSRRALPIDAVDADRRPRVGRSSGVPHVPGRRVEHRIGADSRPAGHAPRAHLGIPDRRGGRLAVLPARPRASAPGRHRGSRAVPPLHPSTTSASGDALSTMTTSVDDISQPALRPSRKRSTSVGNPS